ncbi:O-antigen ligase family protein, partial [Candidatus Parcubacteria bacterium]|nr:O-antigen ligase family protein [Candidatus Parcubacteria bacterium]
MNKHTLKVVVFICLFAVPFMPFLVSGSLFFPFITTKAFAFRAAVEVAFAAWLVLAALDLEYRPKKSWMLWALLAFTAVVLVADLAGVAPTKSLWSNFERMEGFITIAHLLALFLIMASVFREADWKRWWNASLVASFLMVLYCSLQLLGVKQINQGGVRVDGTFGNAIYLAVYMLFHIFVALFYLSREWRRRGMRWMYGISMISNAIILYFTATRGTMLGLAGGLVIFALFNIRNRENAWARKASVGLLAGLVILGGGLVAIRNASFVQQSPVLSRFANLSLSELQSQGRYYIWPMAWQGIKERPILGWGQENFNYVFQEHYRPEMYNLEPWFDRAHNVFLDWAIAGGLLALLLYLSLYAIALDMIWRRANLAYLEKTILTALLAAYFFHNLFVFDQLVSYVFFFSLLAYLQARSATEPAWQGALPYDRIALAAVPAGAILLASLYFFTWKPLVANTSLIQALAAAQSSKPDVAVSSFEKAYRSAALGRPEEVEQIVAYAPQILSSSLPMDQKNSFYAFANSAVREQAAKFNNDVRYQLLAGMFT